MSGARRGTLAAVAACLLLCTGCKGLVDIEVPLEGAPTVEAFAGPVALTSVAIEEFSHNSYTSGALGLYDFLFLIPVGVKGFDALAKEEGAVDLGDYWASALQARLDASGGFAAGAGPPVTVELEVTRARKQLTGLGWIVVSWLGNPLFVLLGVPSGEMRVLFDVTFRVRAGDFARRYRYAYDEAGLYGLYYGRDHRMGRSLASIADRLVGDLRQDLLTPPAEDTVGGDGPRPPEKAPRKAKKRPRPRRPS